MIDIFCKNIMPDDFQNKGYILHPSKGKIPFFCNFATIEDLQQAISQLNSLTPKVVSELPAVGETGYLYFVTSADSGEDQSKEYIWVEEENRFELIGSTGVDLSKVVTVDTAQTISGAKNFSDTITIGAGANFLSSGDSAQENIVARFKQATGSFAGYTLSYRNVDNVLRLSLDGGESVFSVNANQEVQFNQGIAVRSSFSCNGSSVFYSGVTINSTMTCSGLASFDNSIALTGENSLFYVGKLWNYGPVGKDMVFNGPADGVVRIPSAVLEKNAKRDTKQGVYDNNDLLNWEMAVVKLASLAIISKTEYDGLSAKNARTFYLTTDTDGSKSLYLGDFLLFSNSPT